MKKIIIVVILLLAIMSLTACVKEKPGRDTTRNTTPISSVL